ncbi:MAG TPA: WG repeat-containing protein, partial [Bacteroidia bacterium]|nr:WG repeat-containing protein [Bacteroidia bacterium]
DKYLSAGRRKTEGVIDTSGKVIIPFKYQKDGFTYTWSDSVATYFSVRTKEGCGVINDSGRVIIPFEYNWVHVEYGTVIMYRSGQDRDFYTKQGKLIGTQTSGQTEVGLVYEARATPKDSFVTGGENRWGWISPDGRWLNTYFYRYTDEFHYGLARIQTDDRHFGFVDEKFEIVIETKYERALPFDHGGIALVFEKKNLKKGIDYWSVLGYIDTHGTEYWE